MSRSQSLSSRGHFSRSDSSRSDTSRSRRCWIWIGVWVALSSVGVGASPAVGQTVDLNYRLHYFNPAIVESGSTFPVGVLLDIESGAPMVSGLSLGVCHDALHLAPLSAQPGPVLATAKNGTPVDFVDLQTDPTLGFTFGLIICFTGCATIAGPQANLVLATVEYQAVGAGGALTTLDYCDTVAIGGNPVPTSIVTTSASQSIPITDAGEITIFATNFMRGDCDNDGLMTISDAIQLLSQLFQGGALQLACADACEVNDDGGLNIADPIAVLQYLFVGGLPPPPPFPDCGVDPTPDAFGCDTQSAPCSP